MPTVILKVQHKDSKKWAGMGTKEFTTIPRVGELLDIMVNDVACTYKVVAFIHPPDVTRTSGDLHAVYVGDSISVRKQLLEKR